MQYLLQVSLIELKNSSRFEVDYESATLNVECPFGDLRVAARLSRLHRLQTTRSCGSEVPEKLAFGGDGEPISECSLDLRPNRRSLTYLPLTTREIRKVHRRGAMRDRSLAQRRH